MQEKLMREVEVDEAEMSIEGISSPIAQHILDFCDDGGGGDLYPIGSPTTPPALSSTDVADSTTTDVIPDISDTFEDLTSMDANFPSIEMIASLDDFLGNPNHSDLASNQPHQQQQQQSVPSINFNNLLPQRTQSISRSDFFPEEDNQTKAPEDMSNTASQFLMRAPPTNLMQVGPMHIQHQGGLMGIENSVLPLQMIQQNNTDRQRFFHSGNSSNALAIPGLDGMISPFANGGREQLRRIFSSGNIQVIRGGQNIMAGCSESNAPPVLASTEPTSAALEESSSYKVGRLTQEERKAKIDRYIRKRNERNFKKKIKYACRKTLADSRPRVRGRFAKNDEFEEPMRRTYSNGSYDDEGTSPMVPVKEDEDVLDPSDILAHISGVNSFNFTLPSDTTWSV